MCTNIQRARCPLESDVLNHKTREIKMSKYGEDLRLSRAISPNLALFANHYVAPKIPVLETNVTNGALTTLPNRSLHAVNQPSTSGTCHSENKLPLDI